MRRSDEPDDLAQTVVTGDDEADADDEPRPPGTLQLVVIGDGMLSSHPLPRSERISIGRSPSCDILIDDNTISRKHAILQLGGTFRIEDTGSANGTTVRGRKLDLAQPTEIGLGEAVNLGSVTIMLQQSSRASRARRVATHEALLAELERECRNAEELGTSVALLRIHTDRRAPPGVLEQTLAQTVRESDLLAKYGPSEYEVLMPDTPAAQAEAAARRLDGELLERGLRCRSFVACCPRDGATAQALVAFVQAPPVSEAPAEPGQDIVIGDPLMRGVMRVIEQVASSNIGVLFLGETGVGKEVFAHALHRASSRSDGPFVEVNCAAITETLFESELFGHEKGAFTHAAAAKPGLLETAHGGTLLLDEVGDMPPAIQVKLLRFLEDSQLRRVGGLKSRPIDVRIVAATNIDLEEQIVRGTFRRDLFYRLNGITIVLPPLRERPAELEPMARTFIARNWTRKDAPPPQLAPDALELIRRYEWPGNVRELKHVIARAVLLCGNGPILPVHLQLETPTTSSIRSRLAADTERIEADDDPLPRHKGEDEQHWILRGLELAGGNQTRAARLLGISRRTLVSRLGEYQIDRPRKNKQKPADT